MAKEKALKNEMTEIYPAVTDAIPHALRKLAGTEFGDLRLLQTHAPKYEEIQRKLGVKAEMMETLYTVMAETQAVL
jgi:hypothetical protein